VPGYDAVLVDEGQDFRLEWWSALRAVARYDGEMLLVADRAQDIYERGAMWTEQAMIGAGFPGGRWSELNVSYRMPVELTHLLAAFHDLFLHDSEIQPLVAASQQELPLLRLRWRQTSPDSLGSHIVDELVGLVDDGAFSDVCVIADNKDSALTAITELEARKIRCVHTLGKDPREERTRKHAFFRGDARVKVTTIHSFKGWESPRLLVALSEPSPAVAYTALTRLLRNDAGSSLTVVCSSDYFREFGASWPDFVDSAR